MKESERMISSSPSKPWSDTRNGRIAVIASVAGLFILVFWLALKSRRMVGTPPALVIEGQYLSFGEAWEDPAFVWKLPIHNTTNDDVEVADFATDCSCSKVEPSSLTIPAHRTADVRLTLNLYNRSKRSDSTFEARDVKIQIRPRTPKRLGMPPSWVVHGKVKKAFIIEPPLVDFEDRLVRGQNFTPSSTSVTACMDVAELTSHCDSPFLMVKTLRDSKDPRRFRLEVQPRERMPADWFHHRIRLVALTPSKTRISGTVSVVGRVFEDVGVQPESFALGANFIGVKFQETITLQSRSGQLFAVQGIDYEGAKSFNIDLYRKWKDGRQSYIVSCSVERLGNQKHKIHFKVKTSRGLLDVPLRVSYYGIQQQHSAVAK